MVKIACWTGDPVSKHGSEPSRKLLRNCPLVSSTIVGSNGTSRFQLPAISLKSVSEYGKYGKRCVFTPFSVADCTCLVTFVCRQQTSRNRLFIAWNKYNWGRRARRIFHQTAKSAETTSHRIVSRRSAIYKKQLNSSWVHDRFLCVSHTRASFAPSAYRTKTVSSHHNAATYPK